jgi:uncharacterized protein (DUF2235 family)
MPVYLESEKLDYHYYAGLGTWQKLTSPYPTNVVKIAQAIKPIASDGTPQVLYYDEGVGTEDKADLLFGGAFGKGIDQNIQDA